MSAILTLNAGSSSIKYAVYEAAEEPVHLGGGQVENLNSSARPGRDGGEPAASGTADHGAALAAILSAIGPLLDGREVAAVGHRIVHGGADFVEPAVLDGPTRQALAQLVPLAPLHQPKNLAAVDAAASAFPGALQVGCFDTAFHRGQAFEHEAYGLPRGYYDAGVRRYGFHGLSYQFVAGELRRRHPTLAAGRLIVAHLGNGASLCALRDGRSVATTMGFSTLDGLCMGTRPGQLDPGVLLYLMAEGLDREALGDLLYHRSGLLGLSGLTNDMRALLAHDDPRAAQALAYYVARIRHEIGGLAAALGGLDGLVFCGGVGENAAEIRARVLDGLEFLGLELDPAANAAGAARIGDGPAKVLVIRTDEERVIARAAAQLLAAPAGSAPGVRT